MDIDLEAMKAAAMAATPGEWRYEPPIDDGVHVPWSFVWGPSVRSLGGSSNAQDDADRKFIATANPAAVLALIERLEGAEAALATTIEKLNPTKGDVIVLKTPHTPGWAITEQAKRIRDATGALVIVANDGCSIEMVESEVVRAANAILTEENTRLQRELDDARTQLRRLPQWAQNHITTESVDYDCKKCFDALVARGCFPAPRMILCPTCGNKRCPKASDHELECTGSNEPGQPGSIY